MYFEWHVTVLFDILHEHAWRKIQHEHYQCMLCNAHVFIDYPGYKFMTQEEYAAL